MRGLWLRIGTAEQANNPHVRELWREAEVREEPVIDYGACGRTFAIHPNGDIYQLLEE